MKPFRKVMYMTKDPVCGVQVDENKNLPNSSYQGKQYTFHGQDCKEKFDRNPQQYIGQGQQAGQGQQGGQTQKAGQGGQSQPQQQGGKEQQGGGQQQQERSKTGGGGAGGGA